MYKNLSPTGLGISGRQSELIELALTYGFRGFDVDMEHLVKQAQRTSLDRAKRFVDSAKSFATGCGIGGWKVSTRWTADENTFKQDLAQLSETAEVAGKIGATQSFTVIQPASDTLAYHENFELHRTRLRKAADALAKHNVRLGLDFQPAVKARQGKAHEFIHDFEGIVTLAKTVGASNVGIVLDTWNWYVGGGGLDQLRDLDAQQIVLVRIADIPADADMSNISERQRILPSADGLIDCEAVVKLLAEKGYRGPVTLAPHAGVFSGRTREAIVQKAAESLEQLWLAAGLGKPKGPELMTVGASVNGDEEIEAVEE
jgi:sugar phosphate isomerase/epimerase